VGSTAADEATKPVAWPAALFLPILSICLHGNGFTQHDQSCRPRQMDDCERNFPKVLSWSHLGVRPNRPIRAICFCAGVTLPKWPSSFQTRVDTLLQPFLHTTLSSDTDFCILSILHGRPSQHVHHLFTDFDACPQPRFFYPPTS
jgi:hypothetical protein